MERWEALVMRVDGWLYGALGVEAGLRGIIYLQSLMQDLASRGSIFAWVYEWHQHEAGHLHPPGHPEFQDI